MKIEIYTKSNCSYCQKAKLELKNRNLDYIEYNAEDITYRTELLTRGPSNMKTVPQIFINNEHVGGYNQLMDYFDDYSMNI